MTYFNKTEIKLGTFVRSDRHGYIGRVTDIHLTGCPESDAWIAGQEIPVTPEQVKGVWASFLVHEGGAVVHPVDSLTKIEPFDLDNSFAAEYFEDYV